MSIFSKKKTINLFEGGQSMFETDDLLKKKTASTSLIVQNRFIEFKDNFLIQM